MQLLFDADDFAPGSKLLQQSLSSRKEIARGNKKH